MPPNADTGRVICWFGDASATCEYWFEAGQEWRPICDSHESVARGNLPEHYFRDGNWRYYDRGPSAKGLREQRGG